MKKLPAEWILSPWGIKVIGIIFVYQGRSCQKGTQRPNVSQIFSAKLRSNRCILVAHPCRISIAKSGE
jgi:hypothetical protein